MHSLDKPLISVVTITYNRADLLKECIESVLSQSFADFEYIVCDNASPDHTSAVLNRFADDKRLRTFRHDRNVGGRENLFFATQQAKGDYVIFLTDDDRLEPEALQKTVAVIQKYPEVAYIFSHLPTISFKTGKQVSNVRYHQQDTLIEPGLEAVFKNAKSGWALSRLTYKRSALDWSAWNQYRDSAYPTIILAGKILLNQPAFYIADNLVHHCHDNETYWEEFGNNRLNIKVKTQSDLFKCIRHILDNQPDTPEVRRIIADWEESVIKNYCKWLLPKKRFNLNILEPYQATMSGFPLSTKLKWWVQFFFLKQILFGVGV